MKHAYVSLVLPCRQPPSASQIEQLDALMSDTARMHEIVVVLPFGTDLGDYRDIALSGPVTTVITHIRASPDSALLAGISRAVGDFILEWRGDPERLTREIAENGLALTDSGFELANLVGTETSPMSRFFYKTVNSLRPRSSPVRKTVGRVYSRHAVNQLLAASLFEPQIDVLSAELPVPRTDSVVAIPNPNRRTFPERLIDGAALLSKGTRFGSAVPLSLAALSALFGIGAAVYAMAIFLIRGQTPEGWTTLMVLVGLGFSAILAMMGLIWTRIDGLARGLSQRRDATGNVVVFPPTQEPRA